ncbi:MAG: ester cyclase [Ignavibacteria bacterium]|jgi:steroid delta-isomerase-like uncharacterized protein
MKKEQVKKFYKVLWDAHDKSAMSEILHKDFTFRGSLGQEKRGHNGFTEYVDLVLQALGDYKCLIEELVEEENKVFAKMTFTGIHRDEFMGYEPTNKRVSWKGCALFTFERNLIKDVWVLGDLISLKDQLQSNHL